MNLIEGVLILAAVICAICLTAWVTRGIKELAEEPLEKVRGDSKGE